MADATSSRYDPVVLVGIAHPMATKSLGNGKQKLALCLYPLAPRLNSVRPPVE
ncbi:MAG: hypothetical protein JRI58_09660 [Deltaproteobacteria bacterium]|nr:hypothetical protein [Deltaproteobacteria bacterium]MBW2074997.1 hypothetical protein [Deltaproteobacteria bacterium]